MTDLSYIYTTTALVTKSHKLHYMTLLPVSTRHYARFDWPSKENFTTVPLMTDMAWDQVDTVLLDLTCVYFDKCELAV